MTTQKNGKSFVAQAEEDLFSYAINREETKWLMDRLHQEAKIDRTAVEYELGAIKIVATGWAISFHMEESPYKDAVLSGFWKKVFEFSNELSKTAGTFTGARIDYFQVLKERLDQYVEAISKSPDARNANDPAVAIGPEFAAKCGNRDDIFTQMTGISMFMTNVSRVGSYLKGAGLLTRTDH